LALSPFRQYRQPATLGSAAGASAGCAAAGEPGTLAISLAVRFGFVEHAGLSPTIGSPRVESGSLQNLIGITERCAGLFDSD